MSRSRFIRCRREFRLINLHVCVAFSRRATVRSGLPDWLLNWAALVLHFVEEEKEELARQLSQNVAAYTPAAAELEAKGVSCFFSLNINIRDEE